MNDKRCKMWPTRYTYLLLLAIVLMLTKSSYSLSDKRLCADPKCQEIISLARGTITYNAGEKGMASFKINSPIRVKSKSAGSDPSLWGIEVNGRQGYAPKIYIKEETIRISEKDLKYEVDVVLPGVVSQKPAVIAKKDDQSTAPLQPSEISPVDKRATPETITTAPLDATSADIGKSKTEISNENLVDVPDVATTVHESMEIVDGTAIPVLHNVESNVSGAAVEKSEEVGKEQLSQKLEEKPLAENENLAMNEATDKTIELNSKTTPTPKTKKQNVPNIQVIPNNESEMHSQIDASEKPLQEHTDQHVTEQKTKPVLINEAEDNEEVTEVKQQEKNEHLETSKIIELENIDNKTITGKVFSDDPLIKNIDVAVEGVAAEESTEKVLDTSTQSTVNFEKFKKAEHVIKPDNDAADTGYFVDPYEDDEDDEEDDEVDEDDNEVMQIKSSNIELTTPEPPQKVTDSGYYTMPNANYWEDDEITTTEAPVIVNEATMEIEKENKTEETHKIVQAAPTDATISINSLANEASTKIAEPEVSKEVDSSETEPLVEEIEEAAPETEIYEANVVSNASAEVVHEVHLPENTGALDTESISIPETIPQVPSSLPLVNQPLIPSGRSNEGIEPQIETANEYYRQNMEVPQVEQAINMERRSTPEMAQTETPYEDSTTKSEDQEQKTASHQADSLGAGNIEMITTPSPRDPDASTMLLREEKRDSGLFATMLDTVNNFVTKLSKGPAQQSGRKSDVREDRDEELERILYSDRFVASNEQAALADETFCEKLSPDRCSQKQMVLHPPISSTGSQHCSYEWANVNADNFAEVFLAKVFEMRELLSCLTIAATAVLLFLFGYYCFCNSSREGTLIAKLNLLERSLLASHKENAILRDDLLKTRGKLTSIEDNSFGSNDMVIALKKELECIGQDKRQLQDHVQSLEKELETAAEAGLELNKIVAELLNNQTGQESMIMNSVEDLQMQFNEQQNTILEINANLAEKSRENSELQMMLAEHNVRFEGQIASLQQDNDELEAEKSNLQTRMEELKAEFEDDITKALEGKNVEIKRLQNDIVALNNRFEDVHTKWQTSLAKIEALEDCMKTMKKDPSVNIKEVIKIANVRAELLDLQHQRTTLKSRLEAEAETRLHAEAGLTAANNEVDKLKQEFHQSEKDKLEAQTRLEVLSNYFKEKETQLQKELSLKDAIWLKQQGENTNTVDRLTTMQEEIQSLRSQNDALRAEIEAQLAAHKAQTGTLENRAHETWLAARQSERRYEESRAEAAALRRRLTEIAGAANSGDVNRSGVDGKVSAGELNHAPSPILPPPLMDPTAGSPLLGRLPPPPPQFLPFMGPPPPAFLNMPPPPFLSSVEMRPAPLGRMMSPPLGRYSPIQRERERERGGDYYDDDYDDDDYDDYDVDDDEYDDDENDEAPQRHRQRRRSGNGGDSWNRDNYSPPPPERSYRSHSPTDSRYNYTTYDTETDFSPPPSPPERRFHSSGGSRSGIHVHSFSPQPATTSSPKVSSKETKKIGKGVPNSDSEKSVNSAHHSGRKGKSLV